MSTTSSSSAAPNSGKPSANPRSSTERLIVWGVIIVLLAVAGFEFYVKSSFESADKKVLQKLEAMEKDSKASMRLTDRDMADLLGGKKPEFSGNPGQLYLLNSPYYEAYVWRSLLKNKFEAPPKEPEILNMYALYSGEVRPEKVKYRTKGFDKNRESKEGFFSAYVLYVYYGSPDSKGVREVINVTTERVPYHDEVRTPPDAEELKKRHEQNLARSIGDREKFGPKLTDEQKELMDAWKHPPKDTDENMRNIPNWDPVSNTWKTSSDTPVPSPEPKKEPKKEVEKKAEEPAKTPAPVKPAEDKKPAIDTSKKAESDKAPPKAPADEKKADKKEEKKDEKAEEKKTDEKPKAPAKS